MEAWENALRAAVLLAGAKALGSLLEGIGCGRQDEAIVCDCGARMESHGLKSKPLLTILGPVDYKRSFFQCPCCNPDLSKNPVFRQYASQVERSQDLPSWGG